MVQCGNAPIRGFFAFVACGPCCESNTWRDFRMQNVVIIGSGCAGLTAAIYAARANLKPLVLEGHEPGGQLSITSLVENFPGWPEGIQGPELIDNMKKQAARFGAEYKIAHLDAADLHTHPMKLQTSSGEV